MMSPALAADFSDVPDGAWYAPYLDVAVEARLMDGAGAGCFAPEGTVTLGELAAATARLARYYETGSGELVAAPEWYWAQERLPDGTALRDRTPGWVLDACYHLGTLQGYPLDTEELLASGDPMSLWTMPADRFSLAGGVSCAVGLETNRRFAETGQYVSLWSQWDQVAPASLADTANEDALAMIEVGIMTGVDEKGSFDGRGTVTRAQLAAVLARAVRPELRQEQGRIPADFQGFTLTPFPMPEGFQARMWFYHTSGDDPQLDGQYLKVWSQEEDVMGVVDRDGRFVVPPIYEDIWPFGESGYADAWKQGGCCDKDYVDVHGSALAEPPGPTQPYPFFEWDREHRGYKNPDGSVLVPAEYDGAWGFYEGMGSLCKDGLWGFVDETGELVIPFQYPYEIGEDGFFFDIPMGLFTFREGYGIVSAEDGQGWYRYGVIDKTGRQVVPCVYDYLDPCSEGRMAYGRDGVYGYLDPVTGTEYPVAESGGDSSTDPFRLGLGAFSGGYAPVELFLDGFPHYGASQGVCYVDREGRAVTPPIFYAGGTVQDGKAIVFWGYEPYILSFSEGGGEA